VLLGPGMQHEEALLAFTRALLPALRDDTTLLLDACALPAVSDARSSGWRGPLIVTPHLGEMARLSGHSKDQVRDDAASLASDGARRWQAVVALKGSVTHIATPEGAVWRHDGGNIGLATSGSGDTLAGLVTGLAARGATAEQAACWGVALHALAGQRLAQRLGLLGYLAREITEEIPALMQRFASVVKGHAPQGVSQGLLQNPPP
jgi:ADP-dependent NAD(P)H-hydrate dehydratase